MGRQRHPTGVAESERLLAGLRVQVGAQADAAIKRLTYAEGLTGSEADEAREFQGRVLTALRHLAGNCRCQQRALCLMKATNLLE